MAYMLFTGSRMVTSYEPLIEFSKELKYEATQAHLWFKRETSGARKEGIGTVRQHLDIAEWYVKAMLEGGQKGDYKIIALDDKELISEVQQLRNKLNKFRESTEQRYKLQVQLNTELVGKQEFDTIFQDFISKTSYIEKILHNKIQTDLIDYRKTGIGLLIAAALLAICITFILFRNQQRNTRQITKIKAAKQLIEKKNNKLQTMAHYDFLTNLPNRALLTNLLKTAIANAKRNQQCLVLFL